MNPDAKRHADDEAWDAVQRRSAAHDGCFVYAVATTGIYCRPSCPSRRPRRENVKFYLSAGEAERAGYRSCLRCRPRETAPQAALVARACAALDESARRGERLTLDQLGRAVGKSPAHLQRVFKQAMGVSPRAYAAERRLAAFRGGLRTRRTVTEAIYDAGFGSGSRAYEASDAQLGMTPGTYRRLGEGARIRFAVVESALGWLLVAATARGLCAVRFGDGAAALERELRREFPRAEIAAADRALRDWAARIAAAVAGRAPLEALPLDVRASAFQRAVWEALRALPRGETRTYGELARSIGRPSAARAVARACATNPVAIVVPCHRVLPSTGAVGGYRWGARRKRALLSAEGALRAPSAPNEPLRK